MVIALAIRVLFDYDRYVSETDRGDRDQTSQQGLGLGADLLVRLSKEQTAESGRGKS